MVVSAETMSSAVAEASNYHDWLFHAFVDQLKPGSAVEVGSGHGRFSQLLAPRVERLVVADIDPAAIERIRASLAPDPRISFVVMDGVDRAKLGGPVDNIVLLNVLEHIEDDHGFLARCCDNLTQGGKLVLFVPAFQLLYGRMDREAGHHRRYRRRQLRRLLSQHGFTLETLRYFNAVGFFGWLANKWMDSPIEGDATNAQIRLYDRMIPYLKHVDRFVPWLGQSLLAVARSS
jgi:SAM-dependent methyltransferase